MNVTNTGMQALLQESFNTEARALRDQFLSEGYNLKNEQMLDGFYTFSAITDDGRKAVGSMLGGLPTIWTEETINYPDGRSFVKRSKKEFSVLERYNG